MNADRFLTYSLRDPRLARILAGGIEAVEPGRIIRGQLAKTILPAHNRLFLLGIGKAAEPMTMAAAGFFEDFEQALIITKQAFGKADASSSSRINDRVKVMEAGHPIPDERSLVAGHAVLDFVSAQRHDDLLICLLSGGGSSLVAAPRDGLTLADMQALTASLLNVGAPIDEINTLRTQMDGLKGGGLLAATKAKVLSLILSDVIGDHLETIASGLTAPNRSSHERRLAILKKYGIEEQVSATVLNTMTGESRSEESLIDRVQNVIIANNRSAAEGAEIQARSEGFSSEIINTNLEGEARLLGKQLGGILKVALGQRLPPFCLISGGETTVTIRGNGKGGRNQELALAAVEVMENSQNAMLVSLATDGNDGPTDAGGAVVTGETFRRSKELGMKPAEYLSMNNAYPFFDALGDLLKPGYTGTNVNDLIFLFGL